MMKWTKGTFDYHARFWIKKKSVCNGQFCYSIWRTKQLVLCWSCFAIAKWGVLVIFSCEINHMYYPTTWSNGQKGLSITMHVFESKSVNNGLFCYSFMTNKNIYRLFVHFFNCLGHFFLVKMFWPILTCYKMEQVAHLVDIEISKWENRIYMKSSKETLVNFKTGHGTHWLILNHEFKDTFIKYEIDHSTRDVMDEFPILQHVGGGWFQILKSAILSL